MKNPGFALLSLILSFTLAANSVSAQLSSQDTSATKPVSPKSSQDSLHKPLTQIPYVGSIERNPTELVTDSSMHFLDYRYAGDLLQNVPGVFIRELGSAGQLNGITIDGLDARSITFMMDGVIMNEPFTGIFDPNLMPTEEIERVEIVTGPRAFLYGLNSTGAAINFVTRSKRAIHPYTHIRYSETAYGTGLIDGMFSQDVSRGLNLTLGAQHATTAGRFPNSSDDSWNGRVKLRYDISNRLNMYSSFMYNQTYIGLNGGVDITKTPDSLRYDPRQATMLYLSSYQKVTRYDWQLGAAAELFDDSTAVTALTLYHSTNFREYRDDPNISNPNDIFVHEDTRSQWYGAKLTQHFQLGISLLDLGAEVQSRGVIASNMIGQDINSLSSIWGKVDIAFLNGRSSLFCKYNHYLNDNPFSFGYDFLLPILSTVQLFAGLSSSYRLPTIQETHLPDSTIGTLSAGVWTENHVLLEGGVQYHNEQSSIRLRFFHDRIDAFILIVPVAFQGLGPNPDPPPQEDIYGIDGSLSLHIKSIYFEFNSGYFYNGETWLRQIIYPKWRFSGGLYYWNKLFNNHLDLKTGFRGKTFSAQNGVEFNQREQVYLPNISMDIPSAGSLDFFLIAHLGDAYIHFIMENLLDRQYIMTSFYPMPDRELRFGVSWEFKD